MYFDTILTSISRSANLSYAFVCFWLKCLYGLYKTPFMQNSYSSPHFLILITFAGEAQVMKPLIIQFYLLL
jgi:hypothetical protein